MRSQRFLPRVPWCFLLSPTEASCSGRDESPLLGVEQTIDQTLSCKGAARLPGHKARSACFFSGWSSTGSRGAHIHPLAESGEHASGPELGPFSLPLLSTGCTPWQLTSALTLSTLASGSIVVAGSCHLLFLRCPVSCVLTFPEAENSPPFSPAMFTQSASMKSSLLSSPYASCRHHGYHLPPLSSSPWLPFTIIITAAMCLARGEALCTSHAFLGRFLFFSSFHR